MFVGMAKSSTSSDMDDSEEASNEEEQASIEQEPSIQLLESETENETFINDRENHETEDEAETPLLAAETDENQSSSSPEIDPNDKLEYRSGESGNSNFYFVFYEIQI